MALRNDACFGKINIFNSKNDCLDLSYGIYNIENLNLKNCKDKAISVGEKSTLNAQKAITKDSNYGLVSKDSSKAIIENLTSNKNRYCVSAYKKKQEFDGGFVKINKMNCNNYHKKLEKDDFSKVFIYNELM